MNHLSYFSDKSLTISLAGNDGLKIRGLSSLPGTLRNQTLEYAKTHKPQILFEIRMQDKTVQDEGTTLLCPAMCKQTYKCYGIAYFDTKPGKTLQCIPALCLWYERLKQYLEIKENQK